MSTAAVTRIDRCAFEFEAWGPNEGCREFMTEPEVWRCGEPATEVHVDVDRNLVPSYGEAEVQVSVRTYCAEHGRVVEDGAEEFAHLIPIEVLSHTVRPVHPLGASHEHRDRPVRHHHRGALTMSNAWRQFHPGDRVRILEDWPTVRLAGKTGTVVEALLSGPDEHHEYLIDVDDSIVGRAAFRPSQLALVTDPCNDESPSGFHCDRPAGHPVGWHTGGDAAWPTEES